MSAASYRIFLWRGNLWFDNFEEIKLSNYNGIHSSENCRQNFSGIYSPKVSKSIHRSQYGVGCPFGLEKLVHFVKLGHELYPGHDCANSDMTNAFSSISRKQIIDATQAHFLEISASTSARLQSSNTLWYNGLE